MIEIFHFESMLTELRNQSEISVCVQEGCCDGGKHGPAGLPGPAGPPGLPGPHGTAGSGSGNAVYTRWGRKTCAGSATRLYEGWLKITNIRLLT